jgi:hypothetical protein
LGKHGKKPPKAVLALIAKSKEKSTGRHGKKPPNAVLALIAKSLGKKEQE